MDDALDYLAIARLQAAYGDAVTRRAWDEVRSMFTPDCVLRLDLRSGAAKQFAGVEAIAAFLAASLERFEFFAFTLLNSVVDVDAGCVEATARLYIRELRQERDGHRWSTAVGLYRDAYRKDAGRWRFAARGYSSLARTSPDGTGMVVFPIPGTTS